MNTAVQLRLASTQGHGLRCGLLHGTPREILAGRLGPVALFGPGEVVAYLLQTRRRRARLFVFRTLEVDDRLAAKVPGVWPRVQLLLELHTAGRVRRARGLFSYLVREGPDPGELPDAFYLRVGVAIAGPLRRYAIPLSLLSPQPVPILGRRSRPVRQDAKTGARRTEDVTTTER